MQTSAEAALYLDVSALVKLVVPEPETDALTACVEGQAVLPSCSRARVEVMRAVRPHGADAIAAGRKLLRNSISCSWTTSSSIWQPISTCRCGASTQSMWLPRSNSAIRSRRSSRTTPGWHPPRPRWAFRSPLRCRASRRRQPGLRAWDEPEDPPHLGARLAQSRKLDVELRSGRGEPACGDLQLRRSCLGRGHLTLDLQGDLADPVGLCTESRAASLHVTPELEATDDGIRAPNDNRDGEHTKGDPEDDGLNANREHRPDGTVLRWTPRRGVEQSGSSPGS